MHGDNEAKRKIEEELKKRKSKFVALGSAGLGLFIPIALFLFVITIFYYMHESYIMSSTVGKETIFQDDKLVSDLQKMFDIHEYGIDSDGDGERDRLYKDEFFEQNNFAQELTRQEFIWNDLYGEFNGGEAIPYPDEKGDLDLEKYIITINYQSYLNLGSFYTNYDDDYDELIIHDDVKLNEYENERVANNRDVRNFYEQARDKIGSAFFLYPGMRKLVGNNIKAALIFDTVSPAYYCPKGEEMCALINLEKILSQWYLVGMMYMNDEKEYNAYFNTYPAIGPMKSAQYLTSALNYGYTTCNLGKESVGDKYDSWLHYNVCNDYNLIHKESNYYTSSSFGYPEDDVEILQNAIDIHLGLEAELPAYEYAEDGSISYTNIKLFVPLEDVDEESERLFITAKLERKVDDDAYDEYLKNGFIPAVYIYCDGCNRNKSVDSVYTEIKQYEETYRYFNKQFYEKNTSDSSSIASSFANVNYMCSTGSNPHVTTYSDHHGLDINSVPVGTSIYPLFAGEVVYVADSCKTNYPPTPTASGGYNCYNANIHSCGYGTYVVVRGVAKNGKTYDAMYAHLSGVNVTVGQKVTLNTVIGALGNTGCSTGPHLHLELRDDHTNNSTWHLPTEPGYSYNEIANTLCSRAVDREVNNET